ncbi:hypothetical protein ACF0H5_011883 [Mactra antiquata]
MNMMEGKIQTVLGCIEPEEAGFTLAHEHLLCDFEYLVHKYPPKHCPENCTRKLTPDINWWVTHYPYSSYDNNRLYEEKQAIVDELHFYKKNGGGTIVENTTYGIQPDVKSLADISKTTGVHLVAGTGWYVESSRPTTLDIKQEQFADIMRTELTQGCNGSTYKAGMIGEVGCSWPITVSERRVLEATAELEIETGCPVIMHPGWDPASPFEVMRIYQEAGGHADRVVMSHMDRTYFNIPDLLEFAAVGCYVEYDHFGLETSYYHLHEETDMPSDSTRILNIKALIDAGFEDRITIGHDIHTKHSLMKYGGHGFSHIMLQAVPRMLQRGITQLQVDKIVKYNPQTWLTFNKHIQ